MRTAQMMVRNTGDEESVVITLHWARVAQGSPLGIWCCRPGYLPASSGYWNVEPLSQQIVLYDDDDNKVGWTRAMNLDSAGYPLSDLLGESGPFIAERSGIIHELALWEMLSV
jgi:hypothetical protein